MNINISKDKILLAERYTNFLYELDIIENVYDVTVKKEQFQYMFDVMKEVENAAAELIGKAVIATNTITHKSRGCEITRYCGIHEGNVIVEVQYPDKGVDRYFTKDLIER